MNLWKRTGDLYKITLVFVWELCMSYLLTATQGQQRHSMSLLWAEQWVFVIKSHLSFPLQADRKTTKPHVAIVEKIRKYSQLFYCSLFTQTYIYVLKYFIHFINLEYFIHECISIARTLWLRKISIEQNIMAIFLNQWTYFYSILIPVRFGKALPFEEHWHIWVHGTATWVLPVVFIFSHNGHSYVYMILNII